MFINFERYVGLRTRNDRLDFGGDMHSDLDPGILFLHADDFSDESDFNIVYQFNIAK